MIHITPEYFKTPLEEPSSTLLEIHSSYYGYKPFDESLNIALRTDCQQLTNIIHSELIKRSNPGYVCSIEITSSYLGFGSLSPSGIPYSTKISLLPLHLIHSYLKQNTSASNSLLYITLLCEYIIRYQLNKKYNRPLDPFVIPYEGHFSEIYYNPMSLKSYEIFNLQFRPERSYGEFLFFNKRVLELSVEEIKLILYRYMCDFKVPNSSKPLMDNFMLENNFHGSPLFYSDVQGCPIEILIPGLIEELRIRSEEYKRLINNPTNVLFTI